MASLIVRIDSEKREAVFYGAGTFQAKDQIKSLGPARWLQREKVWQVKPFTLSAEELLRLMPEVQVELATSGSAEAQPTNSLGAAGGPVAEITQNLPPSSSVAELLQRVRYALSEAFPGSICVHGLLVSAKTYGERVYLEISDAERRDQRLHAVIWRDATRMLGPLVELGFALEAGLQLMLEVRVDLSPKDGRVSLAVERVVHEYTLAKVAALRDLTNQRLKNEGLFGKNKERTLPLLPRRLGVLTSSGGTVIHDFRSALDQAEFGFELHWLPIAVQGDNAAASIVAGLSLLGRMPLDAVLLFRGGGSPAELAVFSEYAVARAICLCPLPVFTAIGHQADQSSAQDVSYCALGVPKDLGRWFADRVSDLRTGVQQATETLRRVLSQQAELAEELFSRTRRALPQLMQAVCARTAERVQSLARPIPAAAAQLMLLQRERLTHSALKMLTTAAHLAEARTLRLEALEARLEEASPEVQLARGFALVRTADGARYLRRGAELRCGETVQLQFIDQARKAEIKE